MHFFISLNLSLQRLTGIENLHAPRRPPRAQESAPTTASPLPNDEPAILVVSSTNDAPPAHPPTPPPQHMPAENIELVFLGKHYTFLFFIFCFAQLFKL